MKRFLTLSLSAALLILCSISCSSKQENYEPPVIEKLEDLRGHTVAVPSGSRQDLALTDMGGITLVRVQVSDIILTVKSGMAELGIMQTGTARAARLQNHGLTIYKDGFFPGEACVGIAKSNQALCDRFNQFLREFKASGEYDRLIEAWESNCDSMAVIAPIECPPVEGPDPLIVGITVGISPYLLLKNGQYTGMEIDIFNHFSQATGTPVSYIECEFSALISSVSTGKIDAIVSHMAKSEERAKKILFTDPVVVGLCAVIGRIPGAASEVQKPGLWQRIMESIQLNLIKEGRWKLLTDGLAVTILISILSILAGTLVGILLCLLRMRSRGRMEKVMGYIIDLIRGIPILIILMIMFYVIFGSVSISGVAIAIFSFGLYYGAYFAEIFRSGMMSVGRGQWEAGAALGLSRIQTFRLIALPQALKMILPVYKGDVVTLIKGTSIVGYVAIKDLTKGGDTIRALTMDPFFPLIIITIAYFILSGLAEWGLDALYARLTRTNAGSDIIKKTPNHDNS